MLTAMSQMTFRPLDPKTVDTSSKKRVKCRCCPYGYHIDLDFVRFCESLKHEARATNACANGVSNARSDRRRQRKSMDVLLGLMKPRSRSVTPEDDVWHGFEYAHVSDHQRRLVIDSIKNFDLKTRRSRNDAIDCDFQEVVTDFERTLAESDRKRSTSPFRRADSSTSSGSFNVNSWSSTLPSAKSSTKSRSWLTYTLNDKLSDTISDKLDLSSEYSIEKANQLHHIREQIAVSLAEMKDLEEKAQSIPLLQIQITALQEKNRKLTQQLRKYETILSMKPNETIVSSQYRARSNSIGDNHAKIEPIYARVKDVTRHVSRATNTDDHGRKSNLTTSTIHQWTNTPCVNRDILTGLSKITRAVQTLAFLPSLTHISTQITNDDVFFRPIKDMRDVAVTARPHTRDTCDNTILKTIADVGVQVDVDTEVPAARKLTSIIQMTQRPREKTTQTMRATSDKTTETDLKKSQKDRAVQCVSINSRVKLINKASQSEEKTSINVAMQTDRIASVERSDDTNGLIRTEDKSVTAVREHAEQATQTCSSHMTRSLSCTSRIPRPKTPSSPKLSGLGSRSPSSGPDGRRLVRQITRVIPPGQEVFSHVEKKDKSAIVTTPAPSDELVIHEPMSQSCFQFSTSTNDDMSSVSSGHAPNGPSKEMQAAMKVINDCGLKANKCSTGVKNAMAIIQTEWFRTSSRKNADSNAIEHYLDVIEAISPKLLDLIVNMTDKSGNTAMHYAVSHGNYDVVSVLLDSKVCDINRANSAGYTAIMLVSLADVRSSTDTNVIRRLFELADVNVKAKQHGQTALMLAVSHGRFDITQLLLDAGADVNIQDEDGSTALMCAAEHGYYDIVQLFLTQSDCDVSITDSDGSTALKIAVEANHTDISMLLYAHERMMQTSQSASPYATLSRDKHDTSKDKLQG